MGRLLKITAARAAFLGMAARMRQTVTQATTFEQTILANSVVIVASTLLAYWITHVSLEAYHFLLDTFFVLMATILGVTINALVLLHAFRPLFGMLATIRAVQQGATEQRAQVTVAAADIAQLATAFNAMLDTLETQRHIRLREIATAEENERRRLALELHDATGQDITALMLRLELVDQELAEGPASLEAARAQIAATMALAQRTLRGVQSLARQLRPAVLDDVGLLAALAWLTRELNQAAPARINLMGPLGNNLPTLDPLVETILFRASQEALTNALRHSAAQQIQLTIQVAPNAVVITIHDDGRGFVPREVPAGLGLRGVRERMALVGGTCEIRSAPGQGTTVRITAPSACRISGDDHL